MCCAQTRINILPPTENYDLVMRVGQTDIEDEHIHSDVKRALRQNLFSSSQGKTLVDTMQVSRTNMFSTNFLSNLCGLPLPTLLKGFNSVLTASKWSKKSHQKGEVSNMQI